MAPAGDAVRPWRVLEFFAGMGGMRVALRESGVEAEVVASYEISEICERAYRHNFPPDVVAPDAPRALALRRTTIERIAAGELDALAADVWLMSPPCQPFSRSGRFRDASDARTSALLHLVEVLPRLRHPPSRILLENVIGFERSDSRRLLLEALATLGWQAAELDLRPEGFGLPNSRPRYYGLFRSPAAAAADADAADGDALRWRDASVALQDEPVRLQRRGAGDSAAQCLPLGDFLQESGELAELEAEMKCSLELPQEIMSTHVQGGGRYDMHLRSDRTSACLTKGYGRFPRGYGPLVLIDEADEACVQQRPKLSAASPADGSEAEGGSETYNVWRDGSRLRYLSCREQLRLMGYPEWYAFPRDMTRRERFSLVGNSLNVRVVAWLLSHLLRAPAPAPKTPPAAIMAPSEAGPTSLAPAAAETGAGTEASCCVG